MFGTREEERHKCGLERHALGTSCIYAAHMRTLGHKVGGCGSSAPVINGRVTPTCTR